MKNLKTTVKLFLVLLIVGIMSVGATLAYLSSITETKVNSFSSSRDVSVMLREKAWDGYGFGPEDSDSQGGTAANPDSEIPLDELGITMAQQYVPGENIPKDPTVKNTGDEATGVESYVAIKVEYYMNGSPVSYKEFSEKLLREGGIQFDKNWKNIKEKDNAQLFLYNSTLACGYATQPLFSEVPISLDVTPIKDTATNTEKLPQFEINVTAYAVQAQSMSSTIKSEMISFAGM